MLDDLISRQAAIDALADMHCKSDEDGYVWIIRSDAWARIDALPSAQPKQRWIPCSEKLPEDGQNVLVTYKTTNKIHPCQYHDDGSRNPWYSYIDQCRAHMNVVTAWMPLPKPYMGTQSDISDRRKD